MKLAVAFQFTYLGVPYIYYGDEIGMNGGDDPFGGSGNNGGDDPFGGSGNNGGDDP